MLTLAHPPLVKTFPLAAVKARLQDELIEAVKSEAAIRGIKLPSATSDIAEKPFQIDSLVVVAILCAVEPIIGFELADKIVRSGGYESVDNALAHVISGIEKEWIKHKGGPP